VIESGRRCLPIEVKAARRARLDDASGLEGFLEEHPKAASFGVLLYAGREVVRLTERIVAVPVSGLWR
jgi:hypothetical protein